VHKNFVLKCKRNASSVLSIWVYWDSLTYPLGDVIYFMPPYVIKPEEIDLLARVAREGINRATV